MLRRTGSGEIPPHPGSTGPVPEVGRLRRCVDADQCGPERIEYGSGIGEQVQARPTFERIAGGRKARGGIACHTAVNTIPEGVCAYENGTGAVSASALPEFLAGSGQHL